MRLSPKPPKIDEMDGFTNVNDIFEYSEFGEKICTLIENIEGPGTILFDGSWGIGKTTFILQLAGLLRQRGTPVAYIDAFELDFNEDPFTAIIGGLLTYSDEQSIEGNKIEKLISSAKNLGKRIIPNLANIALKISSSGLVDNETIKDVGTNIKAIKEELEDNSFSLIEQRINQARSQKKEILDFETQIKDLAITLNEDLREKLNLEQNESKSSLVIIVDDLDRCRPDFAIGTLERIKHFFSIDEVTFILVSNVNQLKTALKGKYGANTKSSLYLEKFFHLKISLPNLKKNKNQKKVYIGHLFREFNIVADRQDYTEDLKNYLGDFAESFDLSLRAIEKILLHIIFVVNSSKDNRFRYVGIVVGLCLMRHLNSDLYQKALDGSLNWKEVKEFLKYNAMSEALGPNFFNWWRFFTDKDLSDEPWINQHSNYIARFMADKEYFIPSICRLLDSFSPRPID